MNNINFDENGVFVQKITPIRKAIAKAMKTAKTTIPETTLFIDVDATNLWNLRKENKDTYEAKGIKLTFLPFITKALIDAIHKNPIINSKFVEEKEEIVFHKHVNLGIAVDTPKGLIVPVVHKADTQDMNTLANSINTQAKKAIDSKLTMVDITNSTFTISNYGSVGIKYATPVINFPNVAILGIGSIEEKLKFDSNKNVVVSYVLPLALTIDHRIIDGADGARFLKEIKTILESTEHLKKYLV